MATDIYGNGQIYLYGAVGDWPGEESFTPTDVRQALARHGKKPLTVHINSRGGFVGDGIAIYTLLKDHPAAVRVLVSGIAASAASVIAMAGSEIVMRRGSTMMIHDPARPAFGTAKDFEGFRQELDALANECARIYAERTGKSVAEIRTLMVAETWLTGEQAVAHGFAHSMDSTEALAVARFDYARAYMRAPADLVDEGRRERARASLRSVVDHGNAVANRKPIEKPAPANASLAGIMADYNRRNRPR